MNCEMAVAGSVPIRFKPHSGNTADSTTAIKAFDWIREVAQDKRLVVVGDTKLYTKANEQAVLLADCHMIAPMPWTKPLDEEIAGLPEGQWQLLEYMSERESLRPKKDQRRFWGQEKQVAVVIPVDKNGKVVTNKKLQRVAEFRNFVVRKVFIRSEEELQATRASRLKRMQKTDEELRHLQATVRNYKTTTQLTTKVEKMLVNRKLNEIYQITVTGPTEEDDTRPTSLTFTHNKSALARLEKNDGVYVLRTTPSTSEMSTDAVLREFKNQTRLESRFADYKGPLAVSPVYLKSNKRAVGLLVIVMLALQIYALIERDIRRTLEGQGGKMKGLYPEDRLSRPTTRQILRVFAKYGASLMRMGSRPVWVLDPLSAVQQEILRRLGIDTPGP
jgi:transposase